MTEEPDSVRKGSMTVVTVESGSEMRRLAQGGFALGAGTAVATLLSLPAVAIIVRSLGVRSYGTLAFSLGLVQVAAILADLGLPDGVTRMAALAGPPEDIRWARSGLRIVALSGSIAAAVCVAIAFGTSEPTKDVLLAMSILPLAIVSRSVIAGFLRVRRRIALVEGSYVLGQLFYYVAAMAVAGLGLATATRIAVLRTLATSLPLLTLVPTYLRVTANPPRGPATWRQLVRFSFPLLLAGFGAFALQQSDVIMLGVIRGSRAVGLYSPVLLTVDFVSLILYVLSTYYLPLATGIVAQGDLARLRSFYATVTKWGIVLAGPLLAALVVAPGPLLALLFGPRYGGSQAVAIARILSVGYAVTMLMGLNGVNLVALGATKAVGIRSSVGFFANILLNVVLISRFGAIGAAIGTSTVYVGLNLANSMLIWKLGRLHPIRRDVAAVVAAAVSLTMLSFVVVSLFQWSGSLKSSLFTALVVAAGCLATWAATSSRDERRAVFLAFSRKA